MFKRLFFLSLSTGLLFSCNAQVEQYVSEKKPSHFDEDSGLKTMAISLKLTPGKLNATASGMSVQGTVTNTNQSFRMGSDMAVSITINRTKTNIQ